MEYEYTAGDEDSMRLLQWYEAGRASAVNCGVNHFQC